MLRKFVNADLVLFTAACPDANSQDKIKSTKWGSCPMTSHKAYQTVAATVSLGEPRKLQVPQSDVSIDIPEHSPGIYTVHIDTELADTSIEIPPDECLISPVVEVKFQELESSNKGRQEPLATYRVNIPHCLNHTSPKTDVKVHHISSREGNVAREVFIRTGHEPRHGTSQCDS